jgi:hypothetical protein
VLQVNATVVRLKGKGSALQARTKWDEGWRVIALPDHVVELCRRRMAMSWPRNEHDLLFPTAMGAVPNPSNVQRGLRGVLDRIGGYGWVVPHTFRRTVATRLDDACLSARKIADHLGHAKPSMTMDVYLGRKVVPPRRPRSYGRRRHKVVVKWSPNHKRPDNGALTRRFAVVELPGIEPGSFGAGPGLLRAQSAGRFSQPRCSRRHVTDRLSRCDCPGQTPRPGLTSKPPR